MSTKQKAAFEPTIVAFLCNWCTYTAADLAGTSRLVYPANVRIIRMMCSGMVDPKYVLKSFLEGADGVFIGGCWPGDCHYINGNMKARRRVALLHEILDRFGIDRERLWLRSKIAGGRAVIPSTEADSDAGLVVIG